jgi:hypothetical protein
MISRTRNRPRQEPGGVFNQSDNDKGANSQDNPIIARGMEWPGNDIPQGLRYPDPVTSGNLSSDNK